MTSLRIAVVLCALLLASCTSCSECAAACPEELAWHAAVPEPYAYSDVRAATARVCRNDQCLSGDLAALPAVLREGEVGSITLSSAADAGPVSAVAIEVRTRAGRPELTVRWYQSIDAFADGDRYAIEIAAADGSIVAGLAETVVAYERRRVCGDDCLVAYVEGSTL